ncbi:MAG: hypothetical protein HZB24_11280, partial [Desulfobacterales bacterium]|nr:hypothetical protein [Desulfobacterales bacterium]
MDRFKTRALISGFILLLLGGCVYLFLLHASSGDSPAAPAVAKNRPVDETAAREAKGRQATAESAQKHEVTDDEALRQVVAMQAIVSKLLDAYGNSIDHPRIQLQTIQMLIDYLKKLYPDTWREHVEQYLRAAFPEYADRLYARFLSLEEYSRWLQESYKETIAMPADRRRDFLWAKRKQFFGEDAALIWAKDLEEQQVADADAELDQLNQAPFEEKAAYYNARLEEIYADAFDAYKQKYPQKAMDQFLSAEDVQADLRNMPADQRQTSLDDFRRSMGLNEEAVKRWSELDTARDTRWQTGETYMQR